MLVVLGQQHSFGVRGVVMEELGVPERISNVFEKPDCLVFREGTPRGQRDLEHAEAYLVCSRDPLDDLNRRHRDDADHRVNIRPIRLLPEYLGHFPKLG